jgi:hypothetical protein
MSFSQEKESILNSQSATGEQDSPNDIAVSHPTQENSSRRTILLLLAVTAGLLAGANIPLLYGLLQHLPGRRFMGIVAGVRDTNFYFMMMEQADSWRLLLENKFAAGEPNTIYHGFFWALLGRIAHLFGVSNVVAFHAARAAAIILFVPVTWYLVSRFLTSKAERVAALLMICFGAGAGWIWMLNYYRTGVMASAPVDIATPEASSFFTLMSFPHLALALALIGLIFALVGAAISENKLRFALGAGLCGLALGFIHAVNLVVIFAALAVYVAASAVLKKQTRPLRVAIAFGAVAVWPVAYYLYLSLIHPVLLPQLPVRSPAPAAYLVGFAPFLVLSLLYAFSLAKKRALSNKDLLLLCWAVVNFLLLYSYPLISQEARAVLGMQLPLAMLAASGIFQVVLPALGLGRVEGQNARKAAAGLVVAALLVIFTFPSSFCNMIERVSRLRARPEAFSLTHDEYEALRFLREQSGEGVVLSGEVIGNYAPGLTGKYSWLGQYDLPSRDNRYRLAKVLFAEITRDDEREDLLRDNGIEFIYHGPEEREMGDLAPENLSYLERIFSSESVSVYRLKPRQPVARGGSNP